jgi:hypothetical protein
MKFIRQKTKAGEAHRESLRKNLEHRLEVARSKGDQNLLQQLQKEAAYLDLK